MRVMRIGSWQSKALAIVSALSLITAAMIGGVMPIASWRQSLLTDAEDTAKSVSQLRFAIQQGNARSDTVLSTGDNADLDGSFLKGSDIPVIIADLQARLRAIVVGQTAELDSARALPVKEIDQQFYAGARLQIRGTMRGVHAIILAIENVTPFLFVERVHLRIEEPRGSADHTSSEAAMFAELDVYGGLWPAGTVTSGSETK